MTRDKTLAKALGLLLHCYMLNIKYSQEILADTFVQGYFRSIQKRVRCQSYRTLK